MTPGWRAFTWSQSSYGIQYITNAPFGVTINICDRLHDSGYVAVNRLVLVEYPGDGFPYLVTHRAECKTPAEARSIGEAWARGEFSIPKQQQ